MTSEDARCGAACRASTCARGIFGRDHELRLWPTGRGVYDPAMPNYRRWHTGRFVFLTVVTAERRAILCGDLARRLLREAMAAAHAKWPWRTLGLVFLPNHLHLLWELPADDLDYSKRVGRWKSRFTTAWLSAGASEAEVPAGQRRRRLRGVWQQRFFEKVPRVQGARPTGHRLRRGLRRRGGFAAGLRRPGAFVA